MAQARIVYIVDNDVSIRKGVPRLIRASGFETRVFASPESFFEEVKPEPLKPEPFGCVLLHITTPDMTGPQVQAWLKEWKIDMPPPVIVISADAGAAVRESAYRLGAQFFLSKPVDGHALLDTIAWVTGLTDRRSRADGD